MNEIKSQLNAKVGDTSERASRVQQQVNIKKIQQPLVKKGYLGYYATIVAFIGVLVLCINLIPSINDEVGQLTGPEPTETTPPPLEEVDTAVEKKGEYYGLLKQYFFPDETEAVFLGGFENGGVKTHTFWLSDYYVQQVVSNDGGTVERVYRLNGNQIELVYQEMIDGSERTQWSIEELNKLPMLEVLLKAPFEIGDEYGNWTVIETSGQVTTTYGSMSNVLVVENKTDDVRMRKYFVQGFGEVKWEATYLNEESGDYEVASNTDLVGIYSLSDEAANIDYDQTAMIMETVEFDTICFNGRLVVDMSLNVEFVNGCTTDTEKIQSVIKILDSLPIKVSSQEEDGQRVTAIQQTDNYQIYLGNSVSYEDLEYQITIYEDGIFQYQPKGMARLGNITSKPFVEQYNEVKRLLDEMAE